MEALALREPPSEAVRTLQGKLQRATGRRDAIASRLDGVRIKVRDLEAEDEVIDLVGGLFRTLIDNEVTESVKAVERLLSEGLHTVFEDMDIGVRADVEMQRGKVAVGLITVEKHPDGSETEGDPTEMYGGSVATVESVLLRVIVILRREMLPLILLDESLGAVADHYVPRVGKFLSLLCGRLGVDVLAVTHNPTLIEAADRAYRIRKVGGVASFKEIR